MRDIIEWPGQRTFVDLNCVGAIKVYVYSDSCKIMFIDRTFRNSEYWYFDINDGDKDDFERALKYSKSRFKINESSE